MPKSKQLIKSLWPLPGGNDRYFHTLDQIIKWLASTENVTKDQFFTWLADQYNVGEKTAPGYYTVVANLGVLASDSHEIIFLTNFGNKILLAEQKEKIQLVVDRFLQGYVGFREVLSVYKNSPEGLHLKEMVTVLKPHFPNWTSDAQYEYRALWLLSLECLVQVSGRIYKITEFGNEIANKYPLEEDLFHLESQPEVAISIEDEKSEFEYRQEVHSIIAQLVESSTDSSNPNNFERIVAKAFEYLGFSIDLLGEAGNTDILCVAESGPDSYRVIIDTKARKDGKLQDLEVYTIQDHLQNNKGDYAVIVAKSFAKGKIVRHAEENNIVLIPVELLSEWLLLHEKSPLNLATYRSMFTNTGLLTSMPPTIISAKEKFETQSKLVVDLIELVYETYGHGLEQPLPPDQLFGMLVTRLKGVRYSQQEVSDAISLLCHPLIRAAIMDENGRITLLKNRAVLSKTLRVLSERIESLEPET